MKRAILLLISIVLLTGCARTVTEKSDAGSEVNFLISFAGAIDPVQNTYLIVFPKVSELSDVAPVVPGEDPDKQYYFDMPADPNSDFYYKLVDVFVNGNVQKPLGDDPLQYYYANYYSNYYDAIIIRAGWRKLYEGDFPATGNRNTDLSERVNTRFSGTVLASNKLSISVKLAYFNHTYFKGDPIPFFIMAVDNQFKLCDWIPAVGSIVNESGMIYEETDDSISQIDQGVEPAAGLNITTFNVTIR